MNDKAFAPIPDYPGYRVSNMGVVQSCWQLNGRHPRFMDEFRWWDMKLTITTTGYYCVGLYETGKTRQFLVHRLVLMAFVGPAPKGFHGCHNDGCKTNNSLGNLRWDSAKSNCADKQIHGTIACGERCGNSKLTNDLVLEIRRLRAEGVYIKALARRFDVSLPTINRIINRQGWRHL